MIIYQNFKISKIDDIEICFISDANSKTWQESVPRIPFSCTDNLDELDKVHGHLCFHDTILLSTQVFRHLNVTAYVCFLCNRVVLSYQIYVVMK